MILEASGQGKGNSSIIIVALTLALNMLIKMGHRHPNQLLNTRKQIIALARNGAG